MVDAEFAEECLKYHNTLRALHNSPDLVIDIKLNDFAQEWADSIAAKDTLEHRQENDYGENIFVCNTTDPNWKLEPQVPIQAWYDEISLYKFGEPSPADICKVGHFTQLVWRDTQRLGIGMATSESGNVYFVCNYQPAGNIVGEFADNVAPKKEDGADSEVPDQASDAGATLDPNTAAELAALARLKAIPEEELRVWSLWLTKVADVALNEWQLWLQAHIQLAARINDQLLKARREIDEEKIRANAQKSEKDDIEAVHDLEGGPETSDAAAATHDGGDKGVDGNKEEAAAAASAAAEKAEFRDDVASIGIVPTCDALKSIPMPRDAQEMLRIVRQFRRQAKKYQSLYQYWLAQADRVMEEIAGKSTTEQVHTHEEIPSFFYLQDEPDVDIRIDDNEDDDEDDDVEMPHGSLERITCRGDLHLFFNLAVEPDDIDEAISDERTED